MNIIGCQVETTKDIAKNLEKVLYIIDTEMFDFCIFPELHLTSYDFEYINSLEDNIIEHSLNRIKNKLKENQIVILGTVWNQYNSAAIISSKNILFYNKSTLTEKDKTFFKKDQELKIINFCDYKIGFLICRDQDNMTLINSYKEQNIDILVQLSAHFYAPKIAIERLDKNIAMPIVRAIDSKSLLVKINSVGNLNDEISLGNSIIVNKKGIVFKQANKYNEEIIKFNTKDIKCK